MKPYDYKRELVMLNIERHPKYIPEIISSLKDAKKELRKLKESEDSGK